jgi:cell division protein FtsL
VSYERYQLQDKIVKNEHTIREIEKCRMGVVWERNDHHSKQEKPQIIRIHSKMFSNLERNLCMNVILGFSSIFFNVLTEKV